MRGDEIISPTAKRKMPRKTIAGAETKASPMTTKPSAQMKRPKRKDGMALNFSAMRETRAGR